MCGKILYLLLLCIILVNCDIPGNNPYCTDFGIGSASAVYDGYSLLSINDINNPTIYGYLMSEYNYRDSFFGFGFIGTKTGLTPLSNTTETISQCYIMDANRNCLFLNNNPVFISDYNGNCKTSFNPGYYYYLSVNDIAMKTLTQNVYSSINCDANIDQYSISLAGIFGKCSTIFDMTCGQTKTIYIATNETKTMKFMITDENYVGHFETCFSDTNLNVQMRIYDNTTKQLINCDNTNIISENTKCSICNGLYNPPKISYNYESSKGKTFTLEIKASKSNSYSNGYIKLYWNCNKYTTSTTKPITTSSVNNNSNMDSFFDTYLNNPLILVLLGVILFSLCLLLIICVYKYRKIKRVHQNNREGEVALIDVSYNEIDRENIISIPDEKEGTKIVEPEVEVEYEDEQQIPQSVIDSQLKMLQECQNNKGKKCKSKKVKKQSKKPKSKRNRKKSKSKSKSKSKQKNNNDIDKRYESDSGVIVNEADIAAPDPNNVIYFEGYVDEYELNRDGI